MEVYNECSFEEIWWEAFEIFNNIESNIYFWKLQWRHFWDEKYQRSRWEKSRFIDIYSKSFFFLLASDEGQKREWFSFLVPHAGACRAIVGLHEHLTGGKPRTSVLKNTSSSPRVCPRKTNGAQSVICEVSTPRPAVSAGERRHFHLNDNPSAEACQQSFTPTVLWSEPLDLVLLLSELVERRNVTREKSSRNLTSQIL